MLFGHYITLYERFLSLSSYSIVQLLIVTCTYWENPYSWDLCCPSLLYPLIRNNILSQSHIISYPQHIVVDS